MLYTTRIIVRQQAKFFSFLICLLGVAEQCSSQGLPSQNFVMTNMVKQPGVVTENQIPVLSIPGQGKAQSMAYFDGLGRPLQTVVTQGSATQKDIIAGVEYDDFGREVKKYLPYVDINGTGGIGSLRTVWKTSQAAFYNGQLIGVESDAFPYSQTDFEASPLKRVTKTFAQGASWAGSRGTANEHGVEQQYLVNTQTENVKLFNIDYTIGSIPQTNALYGDGQLYKNLSIDEHQKKVIEYNDKDGRIVLKKVQIAASPGIDETGWLCTYYVYDDLNNLRFVIPPKAVEAMAGNSLSSIAGELCFRYEYDQRNRMIIKKVPGAAEVYMVYDKRDRLVFTQDGNLRIKKQWLTTLYDPLNRPVMTGLTTYDATRASMQQSVDQNTGSGTPGSVTTNRPIVASIIIGQRVVGKTTYQATTSIEFSNGFSSEDGANFTTEFTSGTASESNAVVDNPIPVGGTFITLTITYYDNYSWAGSNSNYTPEFNSKLGDGGNPNAENLPASAAAQQRNTTGMVTGTRIRVLENENYGNGIFLATINYYDDRGRVIQTQSENLKGGIDISNTRYDFSGKVLSNYISHNNTAAANGKIGVLTTMKYDAGDRLLQVNKVIYDNDGTTASGSSSIAKNDYNELGQLTRKTVDPDYNSAAGLEKLDYEYNIRGWLLGVNRPYTRTTASDHFFGFDLGYDKTNNNLVGGLTYAAAQYNGNITGMVWKSAGDLEKRKYDFTYDAANRLKTADFNQYAGAAFDKSAGINYSVDNLDYDANGNIKSMRQMGWKLGGAANTPVDDLTYTYTPNSNKLLNVKDIQNQADTKLGDFRTSSLYLQQNPNKGTASTPQDLALIADYSYDDNGNLTKDLNKDIDNGAPGGILYNYLNLPYQITIKNSNGIKGVINYIYDATGNKLEKKVDEKASSTNNTPAKATATTYISGFVYENNELQFFRQEEGRIRRILNAQGAVQYVFDFMLKDHLGNVRALLTDQQQVDMYPAATMEPSNATSELRYYTDKIVSARVPKSSVSGYPADNSMNPATNDYVAKVVGNENKIGPGITLKVMAGDKFNIKVSSWWTTNGGNNAGTAQTQAVATELLNALAGGFGSLAGVHGSTAELSTGTALNPGISSFMSNKNQDPGTGKPKAFLNWILFDEQFKYVETGSGADPVDPNSGFKSHMITDWPINRNGYLYVYVSNESPNIPVFFDNLQVTHTRGRLLEETHYYPFGLTMAGISSKALNFGGNENRYKYNGGNELQSKEFSDGSGLETYDATNRMYDSQIGRFMQIDELGEVALSWSVYSFANNNPIGFNDPSGLITEEANQAMTRRKHGFTKDDPNNLQNVTVVGKIPTKRLINSYWFYRNYGGGIEHAPKNIQNWLYRYDRTEQWLERLHKSQREDDRNIAEFLTYFIPLPGLAEWKAVARLGRVALKLYKIRRGAVVASSAGGKVLPMTIEKIIQKGTKLEEVINDAKAMTFSTGNEHALVTLASGERAIVSGGEGGIKFAEGEITTLFGHTHPTSAGPSSADFESLIILKQFRQYVFHAGEVTKIIPK